jgi:hypothetical protein
VFEFRARRLVNGGKNAAEAYQEISLFRRFRTQEYLSNAGCSGLIRLRRAWFATEVALLCALISAAPSVMSKRCPMSDETAAVATPAQALPPGSFSVPTAFDLERMLSVNEAAVLVGLSPYSLRRHHRHLIRRLTPGRVGIRLRDVLSIGGNNATATNTTTTRPAKRGTVLPTKIVAIFPS